jgi:hypothetical protein
MYTETLGGGGQIWSGVETIPLDILIALKHDGHYESPRHPQEITDCPLFG